MADETPPPPQRHDSQATNISLLHLDPAPIVSPETEKAQPPLTLAMDDEDLESSASTIKPGSTTAPGLSGSGSAIYYLTRLQKYSSYAMNIFTTLHLTNVSLLPLSTGSADASETYLLMTRELYQTTLAEPLLVGLPFVAHVGSGIALRFIRWRQNLKRYGGATPWLWASDQQNRKVPSALPLLSWISVSGYAFTLFYSAHVFTNRVLPLLVEGDSSNIGLAYVAHGFARHPWISHLAYLGLIFVGAGHMVWGSAKWLGLAPSTRGWLQPRKGEPSEWTDKATRRQRRKKWLGVQGAVLGVAALWASGGLGVVSRAGVSDGWVGKLYDDLFSRVGL